MQKTANLRNICVYCGSGSGRNPAFAEAARDFGKILAGAEIGLVYGGGSLGLMGEIGVAVVVPRHPGRLPSLADLRAHGGERLAAYKLPEAVRAVDALPLTAMNKVDRSQLAAAEGTRTGSPS